MIALAGVQVDILVNLLTGVEGVEGNKDYTIPAIAYVTSTLLLCWVAPSSACMSVQPPAA